MHTAATFHPFGALLFPKEKGLAGTDVCLNITMKNLYVCGDSYSLYEDEGLSWPQILANKYNLNLTHTGEVGCSNYRIFTRTLYDSNTFDTDTVAIISWSFPERIAYWNHKGFIKPVGGHFISVNDPTRPFGFYETLNETVDNPLARNIYVNMLKLNLSSEANYMDTIYYMIALHGMLQSLNVKHFFVFARQWPYVYNEQFKPFNDLLARMKELPLIDPRQYGYIDDAISQNYQHKDTGHVFQDGHSYIAEQLDKTLKEFKIIEG